jgi:hypothetical protein
MRRFPRALDIHEVTIQSNGLQELVRHRLSRKRYLVHLPHTYRLNSLIVDVENVVEVHEALVARLGCATKELYL